MIPQAHKINDKCYVPIMNNQILDNVDIIEIPTKVPRKRRIINGRIIDLTRKHDYKTDTLGWLNDNSIVTTVVYMEKVKNEDTGQVMLHLILQDDKKELGRARLSSQKAFEMMDIVYKLFEKHRPPILSDELDFSKESIVLMVLLQSEDFSFTKKDLVNLGMIEVTVNTVLKRMIERKIIFCTGNIGRQKLYSATLPREDFINFFRNKNEWNGMEIVDKITGDCKTFSALNLLNNTDYNKGYVTAMNDILKNIDRYKKGDE